MQHHSLRRASGSSWTPKALQAGILWSISLATGVSQAGNFLQLPGGNQNPLGTSITINAGDTAKNYNTDYTNSGEILISPTGTLEALNSFYNPGTITVSGDSSVVSNYGLLTNSAVFDNSGVVDVLGGILANRSTFRYSGAVNLKETSPGSGVVGNFTNYGTVEALAASALNGGYITNYGSWIAGGETAVFGIFNGFGGSSNRPTLVVSQTGSLTATDINNYQDGKLQIDGTLQSLRDFTNRGNFEYSGTVNNSGVITNAPATAPPFGQFNYFGNILTTGSTAVLNNSGTIIHDGNIFEISGTVNNSGTLLFRKSGGMAGTINNTGNIVLDPGITVGGDAALYHTGGIIDVGAGSTLVATTVYVDGGKIQGSGTISVTNIELGPLGILAPGDPQTLTINGSLFVNGGTIDLKIAGAGLGDYDVLNVIGDANITSGTLRLEFINGYLPSVGDAYRLFKVSGSVTGLEGLTVQVFGAPEGFDYSLDFGTAGLALSVLNVAAPVPLPAAAWLLVSGLGCLGLARPRRRSAGADERAALKSQFHLHILPV